MTHGINVNAPLLASYVNGNYNVELYADGTKIRFGDVEEFKPDFPENIDVCITRKCDGGCPYCYEGCTINGSHGLLLDGNGELLNWMQSLHPGTELALNGNSLDHPDLERALILLREKGVFVNMTINQIHLAPNFAKLLDWQRRGLIWGLGVSLVDSESDVFYTCIKHFKNVVIHTIAGIITVEDLINLQSIKPKVLVLGYKNIGRARNYSLNHADEIMHNIEELKVNLPMFIANEYFSGVCFDNLAIDQLDVKNLLFKNNEEGWNQFYMGDDGTHTMYIDAVEDRYAKNSCMSKEERYNINDKTVDEMFKHIRDTYIAYSETSPEVLKVSSDESKS